MLSLVALAFADNRLILFDQSDFGAKRGWYLAFENQGTDGTPLPVESLRLILAIGDGKQWRFAETKGFRLGQTLEAGAKIGRDGGTLLVDGREVGKIEARLLPTDGPFVAGRYPDWAAAPAAYRLQRGEYRAATKGEVSFGDHGIVTTGDLRGAFPAARLEAFEKPLEKRLGGGTFIDRAELSCRVTIALPPALGKGIIDAYGQVVGAEPPNPVRSDADLRAAIADEAKRTKTWKRDPTLDPYGGFKKASWHQRPTGFYRVVKWGGKWTMVSPQGNPLFYTGLCTAPALRWDMTPTTGREEIFAALPPQGDLWKKGAWGDDADYFSPVGWSLQRKYGAGWEAKATASVRTRLAQWGFSGMGKWSDAIPGVPRVVDLSADWPKLGRHLDPFDPKAREAARASLVRQLAGVKGDPWVVGTSIGNEYDEIVTLDEIGKLADSPAKDALKGLSPEAARKKYATAYYRFLYETVKAIDKDHLYFGFWIVPGWWQDESDWDLIAPWCDVIGYDRYSDSYTGMAERQKRTDKPVLLGEFAFPAWYGGTRGMGRYGTFVETDADSGRKYAELIADAAKDPYCVGALWFQYRDEPITGRGPGKGPLAAQGEHFAFGFVDVNDRPKWDLVVRAREANRKALSVRSLGH